MAHFQVSTEHLQGNAADLHERPLATMADLAAYLGIPEKTIRRWRHDGTGPRGLRLGKHVRFRWSDVDAWLEKQASENGGDGNAA